METNRFEDLWLGGRMSRRQAKGVLASYGIGMAAMPMPGGSARAAEDQAMMFTWAGYEEPAFNQHYFDTYGAWPSFSFFADEEEAFNKMRAGFAPDVMLPCSYKVPLWHEAELLAPVDTSLLTNWPDLLPPLKDIPGTVIGGEHFFVPQEWGITGLMVRTDLAPELADPANQSWGIMWDEAYAGRLGHFDSINDNVVIAAVYAGVADPFNMTDAEIAEVRDLLAKRTPLLRMMASSVTDLSQALASGELVASVAWNSMSAHAVEAAAETGSGAELQWVNPREGVLTWVCGLTIHASAKERGMYEKAHVLIDSFISPEAGVFETTNWLYGHSNARVYDLVDDATLQAAGLSRDVDGYLDNGIFLEPMPDEDKVAAMWEEVKAGF